MIAEHVNAIILDSNSLTALNPAIAAAHKAGIVVVAVNDDVTSTLAYHVQTVGQQFGATMAKNFVKLLRRRQYRCPTRHRRQRRRCSEASGFNSVLSKYPGIKVLATVYPEWDDAMAQTDMASLLSRYNDINGVFTEGGMEQGVVRAYVAAHAKFVPVTGTDENGFACQLKQYHSQGLQGVQVGTAIYAYALALKTALGVLSGQSSPTWSPSNGRPGIRPNRSSSATPSTRPPCSCRPRPRQRDQAFLPPWSTSTSTRTYR